MTTTGCKYLRKYKIEDCAGILYDKGFNDGIETAISCIGTEVPSADVVEVVRCKDCRFFHNGYDEKCCINHKGVVATDENGFCHHAERKADNG